MSKSQENMEKPVEMPEVDPIFSKVISSMKTVFNRPAMVKTSSYRKSRPKSARPAAQQVPEISQSSRVLTITPQGVTHSFTISHQPNPAPPQIPTNVVPSVEISSDVPFNNDLATLHIIDTKLKNVSREKVLSLEEFMPRTSKTISMPNVPPEICIMPTSHVLERLTSPSDFILAELSVITPAPPIATPVNATVTEVGKSLYQIADTRSSSLTEKYKGVDEPIVTIEISQSSKARTQNLTLHNDDLTTLTSPIDEEKKSESGRKRRKHIKSNDSDSGMSKNSTPDKKDKSEEDGTDQKPRIVLTFQKTGQKNTHNMKIVSELEKIRETRRSTRAKSTVTKQAEINIEQDSEEGNVKTPRKRRQIRCVSNQTDSDDNPCDSNNVRLKRPTRCLSREITDNTVLRNAIPHKEKSYEGTVRLSRRIKPTAKVLANKSLRLGLETQNNARLGILSSPEESVGIQTRRSTRRRTPETKSMSAEITPKSGLRPRRGLNNLSKRSKNLGHSDEELAEPLKESYLSMDEINNRILRTNNLVKSASKRDRKTKESSEENEAKRLEKMKRKHLSKLGLQEVSWQNSRSLSNDNYTDDSTMDSINTEAIAEHLEAQKLILDSQEGLCPQDTVSSASSRDIAMDFPKCLEESNSTSKRRLSYEDLATVTSTTKQEVDCGRRKNTEVVVDDTTVSLSTKHSAHFTECKSLRSPAGAEEGGPRPAMPALEGEARTDACSCCQSSNIYAARNMLPDPYFCRAVESVGSSRVGCCAVADANAPLVRAGPRAPYLATCAGHARRMRMHHCCPSCGLFCTQGTFYMCCSGHLFHVECGLPLGGGLREGETPCCPHCGADRDARCRKVHVEVRANTKSVFFPEQRLQNTPAFITVPSGDRMNRSSTTTPGKVSEFKIDWNNPLIPSDLLPETLDLEAIKKKAETERHKKWDDRLVTAVKCHGDAEIIIAAIVMGANVNRKQSNGSTLAHIAAKRGNLLALYLLGCAGADLDALDDNRRTPLISAIAVPMAKDTDGTKNDDGDSKSQDSQSQDEMDEVASDILDEEDDIGANKELKGRMAARADVVKYLAVVSKKIDHKDERGLTALHWAARRGDVDVATVLLDRCPGSVDVRDAGQWTPLAWAAEHKRHQVARLLVSVGADVSAGDECSRTPLHWSALAGCPRTLSALLLRPAPDHALHARDSNGDTPLHVAARMDHYACVIILLAHGAKASAVNICGESVEDCAGDACYRAVQLNAQMQHMIGSNDGHRTPKLLLSDISNGREPFPIECVNALDDTAAPTDFAYVTDNVKPTQIPLDDTLTTMEGCSCEGVCGLETGCSCVCLSLRASYDSSGRLLQDFPYHEPPIVFECNATCKCNAKTCWNRTVGRLRTSSEGAATFVSVRVERVERGGEGTFSWGLVASATIPRGSPIGVYAGEMLTTGAARDRGNDGYMFAIDVHRSLIQEQNPVDAWLQQTCIDAHRYGSVARFANHSCDPNAVAVRVLTTHRDPTQPTLILFANTNILSGQEITFDYGDKFWSVMGHSVSCWCGAQACRYTPDKVRVLCDARNEDKV